LLGELVFVIAPGWRRTKVLPKGREDIHRAGHSGAVVILSSYSARPRKEGHGDVVMRAWLAHADARNKTLAGKYRTDTYWRPFGPPAPSTQSGTS